MYPAYLSNCDHQTYSISWDKLTNVMRSSDIPLVNIWPFSWDTKSSPGINQKFSWDHLHNSPSVIIGPVSSYLHIIILRSSNSPPLINWPSSNSPLVTIFWSSSGINLQVSWDNPWKSYFLLGLTWWLSWDHLAVCLWSSDLSPKIIRQYSWDHLGVHTWSSYLLLGSITSLLRSSYSLHIII
jgi:hypothetical protein